MRIPGIRQMTTGTLILVILLVGFSVADETSVQPVLPHMFFGAVEVAGSPAADGIRVEARGEGVITGSENPVYTTGGMYGNAGALNRKLIVQGSIEPGSQIEFYVGGLKAEVYDHARETWEQGVMYNPGDLTRLDLRIDTEVTPEVTITATPTTSAASYYQVAASATTSPAGSSIPGVSSPGGAALTGSANPKSTPAVTGGTAVRTQAESGQPVNTGSAPEQGTEPAKDSSTGSGVSSESIPSSWIMGIALVILVVIGAGAYLIKKRKENADSEEPAKEEDK